MGLSIKRSSLSLTHSGSRWTIGFFLSMVCGFFIGRKGGGKKGRKEGREREGREKEKRKEVSWSDRIISCSVGPDSCFIGSTHKKGVLGQRTALPPPPQWVRKEVTVEPKSSS